MTIMAVLVCLALVQDPGEQASERLEIKQPLETWYRIEQGTSPDSRDHCAWAHERLQPVQGRPWAWEYAYKSDGRYQRMTVSGRYETQQIRENVTAKLDGAFEILSLEAELRIAKDSAALHVTRTEKGLQAEVTAFDGRGNTISSRGTTPILYTLALTLLSERQKGGLRRAGRDEAVLVDAAYDFDSMGVRRNVSAEGRLKLADGRSAPVVSVELRPVRCDDTAKPVISVLLDRYGRVVELVGEMGSMVRTAVDNERDARPPSITDRAEGRRDPFTPALTKPKDLEKREEKKGQDPPAPPPAATEESLQKGLADLERRVEEIAKLAAADLSSADEKFEELVASYRILRGSAANRPVMANLLEAAYADAHRVVGGFEHDLRTAAKHLERVRTASQADDEAAAKTATEPLREVAGRRVRTPEEKSRMDKVVQVADGLVAVIAARRELKAMKLVVVGATTRTQMVRVPLQYGLTVFAATARVDTSVGLWKRDEWVIINDVVYRVGEDVGGLGVMVEKIHDHGCTVSYKGAQRDLTLAR